MLYLIKSYLKGNKFIYKIGFSEDSNIETRLSSYFYMNPGSEVISLRQGDEMLEDLIHYYLYYLGYRYQKNNRLDEWFIGSPEVLSIFHISRDSLERKLWKHRDKVFNIDKIKSDKSSDFQLFKYLYLKNKDNFVGERYKIVGNKKLIRLNPKEIDIVFYSKYISNQYYQNKTIKSNPSVYHDEDDKIVNDFLDNYFYKTNIFEEKMKMYCEFMDTYGNNSYIFAAIIHKVDPKFKTFYDLFGTSGCKAIKYRESALRGRVSNNLKSSDLRDRLISYFKVGSRYELKSIKLTLGTLYSDLGITKTPKASDLETYFDIKTILITDPITGKEIKVT
jgi:hypothetical protein